MWLIIQIALGIALGYALIHHHRALLRWAKRLVVIAFVLVMFAAAIWAVSTGISAGKEYFAVSQDGARILVKAGQFLFALFFFGLFISGFAGLGALFDDVEPSFAAGSKAPWYRKAASFLIAIFLLLSGFAWGFPIFENTPVGEVHDAVDRWSRSNGYADLGPMALYGITYQWPWAVWLIKRAISDRRQEKAKAGVTLEDQPL